MNTCSFAMMSKKARYRLRLRSTSRACPGLVQAVGFAWTAASERSEIVVIVAAQREAGSIPVHFCTNHTLTVIPSLSSRWLAATRVNGRLNTLRRRTERRLLAVADHASDLVS